MALKPTPLGVAALSGVLLIAVLAVDASIDRTYTLEVRGVDGWTTVGSSDTSAYAYDAYRYGRTPVTVEDNASVQFRLRVDNGFPWAASELYEVRAQGALVADGSLRADARSTGVATFEVDITTLSEGGLYAPGMEKPSYDAVYFDVRVGDETFGGEALIQEARA